MKRLKPNLISYLFIFSLGSFLLIFVSYGVLDLLLGFNILSSDLVIQTRNVLFGLSFPSFVISFILGIIKFKDSIRKPESKKMFYIIMVLLAIFLSGLFIYGISEILFEFDVLSNNTIIKINDTLGYVNTACLIFIIVLGIIYYIIEKKSKQ